MVTVGEWGGEGGLGLSLVRLQLAAENSGRKKLLLPRPLPPS